MSSEELRLVSPTIDNDGKLPRKYTMAGQGVKKDISPPLEWYRSIALYLWLWFMMLKQRLLILSIC